MSSTCTYCSLPVPSPLWTPEAEPAEGPQYCCFGCRLAHSLVDEQGAEGASRWALTRLGLALFFTMNVMVCTFALWAFDSGGFDISEKFAATFADLLRYACMLLALPVLFLLGRPILENSWQHLRCGILSTDLLLLSGVLAAFGYSIISVWKTQFGYPPGQVYFEVGCMILVMVSLGRWLEATGKLRSTQALDQLQKLLPAQVIKLAEDGTTQEIPLTAVQIGDQLLVQAGQRLPTDGLLASAAASIDEQLISGESWPRERHRGEELRGGTLNLAGNLVLDVTATAAEGTLSRLIAAVREARLQKGEFEQLADRLSRWFFPVMLVIATVTFGIHATLTDAVTGLMAALAVVLIACPCALGLATPIAIWAAMGTAARRGIVFRSPEALERLAGLKAIRFDKTGTLTTGQPQVSQLILTDASSRPEALTRAAALAATSPHIFSQAIAVYAQQHLKTESHSTAVSLSAAGEQNRSVSGRGVAACLRNEETVTALGNRPLMDELGLIVPGALEAELEAITQSGQPLVLLGWDGIVQGVFAMAETLRLSAHPVIDWCREQKLDVAVLTGDHQLSGQRLQRELGVPVESALTPVEKAEHVRNLHQHGSNVVFVGDGVNDAPALAVADIGITLGCGADVTRDSADVCLLSDDIGQLPELIELSRQTVSIIRSNLAWAFGYNFCGVLIATTGLLHPAIAAALMVGSSVYVITNSLRLAPPVELQPPAAITAASSRSQQHPESPAASKANQPLEEVVS